MAREAFTWPAIGNNRALEFLDQGLKNNKIAQTYIFIGPDDLGKSTAALAFARNLQGQTEGFNSDLHILKPAEDKKNISIEQVREFIKSLNLSSFLNSYKIGLIKEADCLTTEAQHALLKTLEEPQDKVIIILLLREEENLLPTILSRGQRLYFYPVPSELIYDYLIKNHQVSRSLAKNLASLSLGRPLKARQLFENQELYEEYLTKARLCVDCLKLTLNDRLTLLDKLYTDKGYGAQASRGAQEILAIFEGLSRDLLLLAGEQAERIQHLALAEEIKELFSEINKKNDANSLAVILKWLKDLGLAKDRLAANVNPRLVLEQVLINL